MNWQQANQAYLVAALACVRGALRWRLGETDVSMEALRAAAAAAGEAMPFPAALQRLYSVFQLTPFERDLLLLCAGPELDSSFAGLCATAQGDTRRPFPTFELALACLPDAHWSALLPAAPLRHWRFIEVGAGDTLTRSSLRIDEHVLHFLTGAEYLDERLEGLAHPITGTRDLNASELEQVERIVHLFADKRGALPVVALCGPDHLAAQAVAGAASERLGLGLYGLRADDLPSPVAERQALARLWERETILSGCALVIDVDETNPLQAAVDGAVRAFAESAIRPLFLIAGQRLPLRVARPVVTISLAAPAANEQAALWHKALSTRGVSLNGEVAALASQFQFNPALIEAVCAEVLPQLPPGAPHDEVKNHLWEACRAQARPRLDDLAQRIETRATWDDLVLPPAQRQVLLEIVAHVRQRHTVYETWGFAAHSPRGLGTSVIFAGPSGTGKTLAAEILANVLQLDLYRIDLSAVISKYIGETEKNLRRIFTAAESGGAILLFDEADALFGKRSEVKDSHDRYANIEVSYLLQQMETYRGVAILTTNMLNAFDSAFLRRIRFITQFPFPAAEQRAEIWARAFPRETPTENLDRRKLAQLNITGGNIRNIALNAAFLAADSVEPVSMLHLLRATVGEYAKLEKPLTDAEIKGWV